MKAYARWIGVGLLALVVGLGVSCSAPSREELVTTVALDTTTEQYPAVVWRHVSYASPRAGHAMAYDAVRGRAVVYGGAGGAQDDGTCLWDSRVWSCLFPVPSPVVRYQSTLVWDPVGAQTLAFAGSGRRSLFAWDGAAWSDLTGTSGPSGRSGHVAAFDKRRAKMVIFGGVDATGRLADTWEWDGAAWLMRAPPTSPTARTSSAMVYDEERAEVLLYGGETSVGPSSETWAFNGTTWSKKAPALAPPARVNHSLAYDAIRKRVVLAGGDGDFDAPPVTNTWEWDGTTWANRTPTSGPTGRNNSAMTFDAGRARIVLYGGSDYAGRASSDTWEWNGSAWSAAAPPQSPGDMQEFAFATDPVGRRGVIHGGQTDLQTWTWSSAGWAPRSVAGPPNLVGHAMTYDAARSVFVLFGGYTSTFVVNDTWTWDGAAWLRRTPAVSPPPRQGHAMAYDERRSRVVLFGGLDQTRLADTWEWDGAAWMKKTSARAPAARQAASMTYDVARARVVLFGGAASGPLNDTWEWDGIDWTLMSVPLAPPPRSDAAIFYDRARSRTVIYGGLGSAGALADTWSWDGAAWTILRSNDPPPPMRSARMAATDDLGHALLLESDGIRPKGWTFYALGAACTTTTDCPGATCVDGVCCQSTRCDTCQTCSGLTRGKCSSVVNAEDLDSCAVRNGMSCDAVGDCKLANGAAAASAEACASGFLVDGVCCDTACDGSCQACRDDLKASGQRSGVCDHARDGLDPHDSCASDDATTCQRDGTCDGRGKCRLYAVGTGCGAASCVDNRATGRLCNGFGTCGESADGVSCGLYACRPSVGCTSTCATNADCGARSHCEASQCVANEGASCDGDHTVFTPDDKATDCGKFKCAGATCKASCVSLLDCVSPAVCNAENKCVGDDIAPPDDGGGGCSCRTSKRAATPNVWAWLCALATLWSVRRRAHVGRSRRAQ